MLSTELIALLEDLESDRVERTISVNNNDKFCQAVCAFSNDFPGHNTPGYLIIGADDRGQPNGLTVTDELLTNLAAIRSSGNILPLPALEDILIIYYGNKKGGLRAILVCKLSKITQQTTLIYYS